MDQFFGNGQVIGKYFCRGGSTQRRAAQYALRMGAAFVQVVRHVWRVLTATFIEWAINISLGLIIPTGFSMSNQNQRLHDLSRRRGATTSCCAMTNCPAFIYRALYLQYPEKNTTRWRWRCLDRRWTLLA
jgi:hypothetical protein